MNKLVCWLGTAWHSVPQILKMQPPIMGHSYYETYSNDEVQILKCMRCNEYSVGYFNGGEPAPPMNTKSNIREALKEKKD